SRLDRVAKEHEEVVNKLTDRYNALRKQYASLEDAYRGLKQLRESERREFYSKQPGTSRVQDRSRLLDDGASIDSRRTWESSSYDESGRTSPGSSERTTAQPEESGSQQPITPRPAPQPETHNPFIALIPRRGTSSSKSSSKAPKIKPNSEIRIYGRYIFRSSN